MSETRLLSVDLDGAEPLAAAARFHAEFLPAIRRALTALGEGDSLVLRFDHAEDKPHRWRREAVAALAREYAPVRVNAVVPAARHADKAAFGQAESFLHTNAGVTGQLLVVD